MGSVSPNRQRVEGGSRDAVGRRALLVVGMHRSGTSAVARALSLLGSTMPRTPLPPGWRGEINWGESDPIVKLHDELLASVGSSWDDFAPFPAGWYGSSAADEFRARMAETVASEYGGYRLFVIKDPRICRLVPFWISVLAMLDVDPAFVMPVRNPLEVAASLAARDKFSMPKALLLWLRHVLDAERDSRGHPRAFVAYEALLSEPRSLARAVCERFPLDSLRTDGRTEARLEEFLSANQRHHSFTLEELNARGDVVEWVKLAYAALLGACRSDEEPNTNLLDRVSTTLSSAEFAYGPVLRESEQGAAGLREESQARDQRLAALEQRHERTIAELRTSTRALTANRQELSEARRELARIHRHEVSWASAARQIERSLTWRLGNLLIRALRLLTLRRPVRSQGPGELAADIAATGTAKTRELLAMREGGPRAELEVAIGHARDATRAGNWDEAVSRWRAVLDRFGDDVPPLAYRRLSQACRQTGDDDAAVELVSRGLEQFPGDVDLHVEFAQLAMAAGDWDEAVSRWRAALDRFGDEAPVNVYIRLAHAYQMVEAQVAAAEVVTRGLERFPDDVGLHVEFAELAMATCDWDEAVSRWRAVLDRFGPETPAAARVGLIRALLNTGDEEAADAVTAQQAAQSLDDYQGWILANDLLSRADRHAIRGRIDSISEPPTFSVLMPVFNTRPHHLRQALDSMVAQLYPHWELCIVDDASTALHVREILEGYADRDERIRLRFNSRNRGIASATNAALETATGDWVVLFDHDDVLAEHALYLMAEAVAESPNACVLYSDSDHLDQRERRINPFFKPDWDPDLFLGQNYINHLGVYRADLARAVGGFRQGYEGSQDWDFALRIIEMTAEDSIVHVPHILYHWRISRSSFSQTQPEDAAESASRAVSDHLERVDSDATVEPGVGPSWNRVKWPIPSPPPVVSVVIPTRDRFALLRNCVDCVLNRTSYEAVEIVVVDNDSRDPEALAYLEAINKCENVLIIRDHEDFNFSRMCNRGVAASHGEIILLLNNDIEVIHPDWLHELVGHATRPEVGAVGAKLYYGNDSIQHAGVILGIGKNAVGGHAYRFYPRISESSQPFGRTRLTRNYSAVTGACMALRRDVYEEVGGLDEVNLPVASNDVDLCLRVRRAGYRVVWTPFAQLYHYESTSRGTDTTPEEITRARSEIEYMHETWGELLMADPFFNPNLSLATEDFSLATPARAQKPWRS